MLIKTTSSGVYIDLADPDEWRVDFGTTRDVNTGLLALQTGGENERTAIPACPVGDYWYPGYNVQGSTNDIDLFGAYLRNTGILTQQTLTNYDYEACEWIWENGRTDYPNVGTSTDPAAGMSTEQGWPLKKKRGLLSSVASWFRRLF